MIMIQLVHAQSHCTLGIRVREMGGMSPVLLSPSPSLLSHPLPTHSHVNTVLQELMSSSLTCGIGNTVAGIVEFYKCVTVRVSSGG